MFLLNSRSMDAVKSAQSSALVGILWAVGTVDIEEIEFSVQFCIMTVCY